MRWSEWREVGIQNTWWVPRVANTNSNACMNSKKEKERVLFYRGFISPQNLKSSSNCPSERGKQIWRGIYEVSLTMYNEVCHNRLNTNFFTFFTITIVFLKRIQETSVLTSLWLWFQNLLGGVSIAEVDFRDFSFATVRNLLDYAYTRQLPLDIVEQHGVQIWAIANRYEFSYLRKCVEDNISKVLRLGTVVRVAAMAKKYQSRAIETTCLRFMLEMQWRT